MDKNSVFFDDDLNYLRKSLIEHPLYNSMTNLSDIKKFMEVHVYAVWDFMSLVKNLQMNLTCISTPWIPSENSLTARLINEIVWGEETDIDKNKVAKSHFEMYLDSMNEIGANTNKIENLIELVKQGKVKEASKAIQPAITYFKRIRCNKIILGCTELPVAVFAFKSYKFAKESKIFIDPNLILAEVCKAKYKSI